MMRVSVAVAAFLWAAGVAHADPTSQKRADELFAEGRKLIEKHDDAGACEKFDEAIKLDPDAAGTMLNLGLCNQNLKKYRRALYWYRKAQVRAHETSLPEYEQAAGQRTKDLVELVSVIKVELSATTPVDAQVTIAILRRPAPGSTTTVSSPGTRLTVIVLPPLPETSNSSRAGRCAGACASSV